MGGGSGYIWRLIRRGSVSCGEMIKEDFDERMAIGLAGCCRFLLMAHNRFPESTPLVSTKAERFSAI